MICWDRCGRSGYVGVFERHEITVLQSYVAGLLELIERRTASYVPVAIGTYDEVYVPTSVTEDLRLVAILEDEVGAGEPDWVQAVGEGPCLLRVLGLLHLMRSTMPQDDCVVHLRSKDEVDAWLRCIKYFLSSIAAVADAEGMVKGADTIPTIKWLSKVSETLRLAVERTVMARPR